MSDLLAVFLDYLPFLMVWWAGILVAKLILGRGTLDVLTVGFVVATLSTVIFTLVASGSFIHGIRVLHLLFMALGLGLFVILHRKRIEIPIEAIVVSTLLLGLVAILRLRFHLDSFPLESDQFLIGWIADQIRTGEINWESIGTRSLVKRGFAYPILLGAGGNGLLISLTTVIFILLILSAWQIVRTVYPSKISWQMKALAVLLLLVWLSSSMFPAMAFYQNGHALMALGVTLTVRSIMRLSEESRNYGDYWVAVVSSVLVGLTRPEGFVVVSALGVVAGLTTAKSLTSLRWLGLVSSGYGAFLFWMLAVDGFFLSQMPTIALAAPFLAFLVITLLSRLFPAIYKLMNYTQLVALVVFASWYLVVDDPSLSRVWRFITNTFFGAGMWGSGVLFTILLAAPAIFSVFSTSAKIRILILSSLVSLLAVVGAKAFDSPSLHQFAGLSAGWGDSINRGLLHVWGIWASLSVISVSEMLLKSQEEGRAILSPTKPPQ